MLSYTVASLISPEEASTLQTLVLAGEVLTSEGRNKWASEVTLMNASVVHIFIRHTTNL